VLSDWFGYPVILLSSGRAGINIALKAMGFHRYQSTLRVPAFLSTCVMNAITPLAFPVGIAQHGDGMLWYHQFGFQQRHIPSHPNVIEDCAHSFFSTANTGDRKWASDVAIFSLPKFFDIEGMAGGIIVRNAALEEKLRRIVEDAPKDIPEARNWMRKTIAGAFNVEAPLNEKLFVTSAYELLLQFIRPDRDDLAGLPSSTEEIRTIGRARRERLQFVVEFFGESAFPTSLLWNYENIMPFGIPYFGISDDRRREEADALLRDIGIHAGIYRVDVRRDCINAEYWPCILLPCHQNLPLKRLEEACTIIASYRDR